MSTAPPSDGGGGGGGGGFNWLQLAVNVATLSDTPESETRSRGQVLALQLLTARPGQPIVRVYGRMRIGGQIIWRGPVREHISETGGDDGDKGGGGGGGGAPRQRHYRYSLALAIGLCEGPISRIGRIWADGRLLDTTQIDYQLHRGEADAAPDPLIEAAMGAGQTPGFRGLAYIMLRNFDVTAFGNRVPQFSFEIFRPIGDDAIKPKAVCLLPGANEFAYHPEPHIRYLGPGRAIGENISMQAARSDWDISLDQLQEVHEECEAVALVVAWFGTDLRADKCRLLPKVDNHEKQNLPHGWSVAGLSRRQAQLVSHINGRPAFGGTPSDHSVIAAIKDMTQRGLKVMFYPFIMMDVPPDNNLPDPYGGARQAAYPWRGRITADRPPAQHNRPLSTRALNAIMNNFVDGKGGDARFCLRGMVLHYARLCDEAGGVEAFLIGSELRGVSRLCDRRGRYAFADKLRELAAEVREILPDTKISYAADWSEYGSHVASSGNVGFPLDSYWGDKNCDFIGIDNYLPLSDWRDTFDHLDAKAGAAEIYDKDYLQGNIRGGEYFDWYYKNEDDRDSQTRTPITDGSGAPWRFRAKDIEGWWRNTHRPVIDNKEQSPTRWQPRSKPFWFTELGCPAVDKGANQPNIFPDTTSSEGGLPHYSDATRDDHMQRAFLNAVQTYYETGAHNPLGSYGAPMVAAARIFYWAWDARPFPAFPFRRDLWSDGGNWPNGHWLNGRDASAPLAALMQSVAAPLRLQIENVQGQLEGYALRGVGAARDELAPLLTGFGIDALIGGAEIRLRGRRNRPVTRIAPDDILLAPNGRLSLERVMAAPEKAPRRFDVHFLDADGDYGATHVSARYEAGDRPVARLQLPVAMGKAQARHLAAHLLNAARSETETLSMRLPPSYLALEPGDIIQYDGLHWRLMEVVLGAVVELTARRFQAHLFSGTAIGEDTDTALPRVGHIARPELRIIDVPQPARRHFDHASDAPLLAAFAAPWPQSVQVQNGSSVPLSISAPSIMGETLGPLASGPIGRWLHGTVLDIELYGGSLAALPEAEVLTGGNRLAVETERGWEVIQFARAELVGLRRYRLTQLLRGQFGSDAAQATLLKAGATCVLLSNAQVPMANRLADVPPTSTLHYGPPDLPRDGYGWQQQAHILRRVAVQCLAPVHGKLSWPDGFAGDWQISWTRRSRIDGDDFEARFIQLGEAREAYQLTLMADDAVAHQWQSETPTTSLSAAARADYRRTHKRVTNWHLAIAQINTQGESGAPHFLSLPLNRE